MLYLKKAGSKLSWNVKFQRQLQRLKRTYSKDLKPYGPSDNILLLLDKYKGGDPRRGTVDYNTFLLETAIDYLGQDKVIPFFQDEIVLAGEDLCQKLIDVIYASCPKYIVVNPGWVDPDRSVSIEFLVCLAEMIRFPLALVSTDSVWEINQWRAEKLISHAFLHICLDSSVFISSTSHPEKVVGPFHTAYTPIFQDLNKTRDIEVSFVGSMYPDRKEYGEFLLANHVNLCFTGGQVEDQGVSTQDYVDILQRSKIVLNFNGQANATLTQVKGRVFEATLCGALLFSSECTETNKMFCPYEEFIPFSSKEDLLSKIRYYLVKQDEFETIRKAGNFRAQKEYTGKTFWHFIEARFNNYRSGHNAT